MSIPTDQQQRDLLEWVDRRREELFGGLNEQINRHIEELTEATQIIPPEVGQNLRGTVRAPPQRRQFYVFHFLSRLTEEAAEGGRPYRTTVITANLFKSEVDAYVDRTINMLSEYSYTEEVTLSRPPKVTPIANTLNIRTMKLRLSPGFERYGVSNISPSGGALCAIDILASNFVGQISNGKHKITREDIHQYFKDVAHSRGDTVEDGFTIEEMREAVAYYNGSYFVAFDAFGDKLMCWKNPSKRSSSRGGICIYCCDGHAWLFKHEKGAKISASSFGPHAPMPKNMYTFADSRVSLEEILAMPPLTVYVPDLGTSQRLFNTTCVGGFIPRVYRVDEDSGNVASFMTRSGSIIRHCSGGQQAEQFAREMKRTFTGKSILGMGMELLESMGFERSCMNEEVRNIMMSQNYYIHQWYTDKKAVDMREELYGVDIRKCFTWCLTQNLPVLCAGDEPVPFTSDEIHSTSFYYLEHEDANKWPLFGTKKWYLGALVLQLIYDGELSPTSIKYEITPGKISRTDVVEKWLTRVNECPNAKDMVNGVIGYMSLSSTSGGGHDVAVLTSIDEMHSYREQGSTIRLVELESGEYESHTGEVACGDDLWLCMRTRPGRPTNRSYTPQCLAIYCYAALRTYMAARDITYGDDWRSAVKAVCVDSVAVLKDKSIPIHVHKEDCEPGDAWHYENGVPLTGPRISCVKKECVPNMVQWQYNPLVWKNVSVDAGVDILDMEGGLFNAGAGYGKSTFMRRLIFAAADRGLKYLVIGPTGIVVDNYRSCGISDSWTAHRALAVDIEVSPLWNSSVDIVFIDEAFAMQSACLALAVEAKRRWGTRVFMCGDSCQNAPPDGSGAINPDGYLMHYLSGGIKIHGGTNYRITGGGREDAWLAAWLDSYRAAIINDTADSSFSIDWSKFQHGKRGLAICCTREECKNINSSHIRDGRRIKGIDYSIYDGMQLLSIINRGNYFNGQLWTVVSSSELTLRHNKTGRVITLTESDLGDFQMGYSLTGHKIQCESLRDAHTIVDPLRGLRAFGHRWLYTALSRTTEWGNLFVSL